MALRTRGDAMPYRPDRRRRSGARRARSCRPRALPGAVQQGDRRQERLRARERHPPGRHAQERRDLRDHDARESVGIKETTLVMGKHSGRAAFKDKLRGARLRARRQCVPGSLRALQGAGRPQEAHLRRRHRGAGRRRGGLATIGSSSSPCGGRKTGGVHRCDLTLAIDGREDRAATAPARSMRSSSHHRCGSRARNRNRSDRR